MTDLTCGFHFAVGIEDTFVPHETTGHRSLDEYELTQHYQLWQHDLRLAADSGAQFIRWGIPWYRVQPHPNAWDFTWLDDVVAEIDSLGLTCIVDLMHYGTPTWLEGSFLSPDYPLLVTEYATEVAKRYGNSLTAWTPLNEPQINAIHCGEKAMWPPYASGDSGYVQVGLNVVDGIQRTHRALKELDPQHQLVHVEASFLYSGTWFPFDTAHMDSRKHILMDLVMGRVGPSHVLYDWLIKHGATAQRLHDLVDRAVTPDVLGVNYYPAFTTARFERDSAQPVAVEAGTDGLREVLSDFNNRYPGLPIMLTETSRGGTEQERREWLIESVAAVTAMRAEGLPIVGYTWFPLFSLVDWRYRTEPGTVDDWLVHMGLIDLERDAEGVLQRKPLELMQDFRTLATQSLEQPGPPLIGG
jgi:beta-glucosidase